MKMVVLRDQVLVGRFRPGDTDDRPVFAQPIGGLLMPSREGGASLTYTGLPASEAGGCFATKGNQGNPMRAMRDPGDLCLCKQVDKASGQR